MPDEKYIVVHQDCPACKRVHELYEPRLSSGEFQEVELTTDSGQTLAKQFQTDTGKEIDAVPFCVVKEDGKLRECDDDEY